MIHAQDKGLAKKAEAEKWSAVEPAKFVANVIPLPAVAGKQARLLARTR
jgi:hypothetical protein